jgi:hypothetical protein
MDNDLILNDSAGYGRVVALYHEYSLLEVKLSAIHTSPIALDDSRTFAGSKYCHVLSHAIPHLYRVWDTNEPRNWKSPSRTGAFMLGVQGPNQRGVWFSPMRPEHMVDYRNFTAIKHEWDRADYVLDASLTGGASIYVGRAGPQQSGSRRFPGGAIQIFLPRNQFGYLCLNQWWAV